MIALSAFYDIIPWVKFGKTYKPIIATFVVYMMSFCTYLQHFDQGESCVHSFAVCIRQIFLQYNDFKTPHKVLGPYASKSQTGSKVRPGLSGIYFPQKWTFNDTFFVH